MFIVSNTFPEIVQYFTDWFECVLVEHGIYRISIRECTLTKGESMVLVVKFGVMHWTNWTIKKAPVKD